MLGGYQILDLRGIDLSRGSSESSISDVNVLSQLLNIRDHIQKTYDFSKPLHAQLKPLLIRYRDKKNGEKHEVALYGNIEVINTYYKFRIVANNEGEQLTINVEFEEKTDEYSNKYWDIKTAKILLTVNHTIEGDLEVGGDIEATGDVKGASGTFPIINGEENPSVKPIYCHPINLSISVDNVGSVDVSLFIFDNNSTPYTWETFKTWVSNLASAVGTARILTTGRIIIGTDLPQPANYLMATVGYRNFIVKPSSEGETGINLDLSSVWETLTPRYFNDGVNKIN